MKAEIRGLERPSGKVYSFEECWRRNGHILSAIDGMRAIAQELAERESLTGTIYIVNTTGPTRDDCGIGFEYPQDKKIEERLNRTFAAKQATEFAQRLPKQQREQYLKMWRKNGYKGYL